MNTSDRLPIEDNCQMRRDFCQGVTSCDRDGSGADTWSRGAPEGGVAIHRLRCNDLLESWSIRCVCETGVGRRQLRNQPMRPCKVPSPPQSTNRRAAVLRSRRILERAAAPLVWRLRGQNLDRPRISQINRRPEETTPATEQAVTAGFV